MDYRWITGGLPELLPYIFKKKEDNYARIRTHDLEDIEIQSRVFYHQAISLMNCEGKNGDI